MLIDTHAHLYWESYKADFEEVIKRAKESEVSGIINVGVDLELSKVAIETSKKVTQLGIKSFAAIGIHPHEALRYAQDKLDEEILKFERIYQENKEIIVAIGECGLDYFFQHNPGSHPSSLSEDEQKNLQKKLFQAQIDLAKKLNLPLSVHCRDDRSKDPQNSECWDTAIETTKDHFGIYHCYSGLAHNTKYIIHNTSFYVAFAGNITYPKNDYLQEAAKLIPLDRILLETDSPFLAPQSKRGQRNEPSSVKEIAETIADIKGVSLEEIANQTTQNAKRSFRVAF